MPNTSMRLGIRYCLIGVTMLGAFASLFAADLESASQRLEGAAERWGLWAVLAIAFVVASLWQLWQQDKFVRTTLVDLVERSIRSNDKLTNAIKAAPCGKKIHHD